MIANRDAKAARGKHREEERDLKPIETEMVEVDRDSGQGQGCCADKKGAGDPVNAIEWQAQEQSFWLGSF